VYYGAVLSDRLRMTEVSRTRAAIEELRSVAWARPLLARLARAGGVRSDNMPLMFEVRYAHEVHRCGGTAEYEHNAGVGASTVEFKLGGSPSWLVELVSVRKSAAMRRATRSSGIVAVLSPNPRSDRSQSEPAETITAEQKIAEKVFTHGKLTKFPRPSCSFHMIFVDMRGYLDRGGSLLDWRQMAYGPSGVLPRGQAIQWWEGRPIRGLFERDNPIEGAQYVRERIHVIGFVREENYRPGELQNTAYYCPNPSLFASDQEAAAAFASYPLRPDRPVLSVMHKSPPAGR
jgi:hypothetical protein